MRPDEPIDDYERNVRLGCGAITGLPLGLIFGAYTLQLAGLSRWALGLLCAATFAWLALRYGDGFWRLVMKLVAHCH